MIDVEKIAQFLLNTCQLTQFQLWKKHDGTGFSLAISQGIEHILPPSSAISVDFHDYYVEIDHKCTFVIRTDHQWMPSPTEEQILEALLYAYQLALMVEKEQFIREKMMESIREISALNDIQILLTKILENALSVIPSADFGVLWMYDENNTTLIPKAWTGIR